MTAPMIRVLPVMMVCIFITVLVSVHALMDTMQTPRITPAILANILAALAS